MRRRKIVLLFGIYLFMFVSTIVLEGISIHNPHMRLLVNLSTVLLAGVGGSLLWLVYRSGGSSDETAHSRGDSSKQYGKSGEDKKSATDRREAEPVRFDKEKYLSYARKAELTRRETEIGLLVANDYTNLQIAEELFIAETTVKKHLTHIYEKTGTGGRKELKEILKSFS